MSLFFVDSSCDLGKEQISKLGIECINLKYTINDKVYDMEEDFEDNKFFSKFRKGVVVGGIAFKEEEYIAVFEPILKSGEDIIYVYSSGKILDDTALLSARDRLVKEYKDRQLVLIDSENYSMGYGVISFLVAMQYRNGRSVQEIEEYAYKIRDEIACFVTVDSLEELSMSGIIDNKMVSGTALNIKPILSVDIDGGLQIVDKVSGKKKAISKLVEIVRQQGENVVDYPIAIYHAGAEKEAIAMAEKLKEYFGEDIKLFVEAMTPSTASLVGVGAVGVAFHVHRKMH